MKNHYFKSFDVNKSGKDYVVGDIHGNFKELELLLNQIGFNEDHNRLFSTGDLCDRGPYSIEIFNWINKSWFHPARGNHEDMLICYENGLLSESALEIYEALWWKNISKEKRKALIESYLKLPTIVEIVAENSIFGLVHAEPFYIMCKNLDITYFS